MRFDLSVENRRIVHFAENAPPIFQRPNADSPDFEVEKYIRDKYERKLFCSPDKEPPSIPPQVILVVFRCKKDYGAHFNVEQSDCYVLNLKF